MRPLLVGAAYAATRAFGLNSLLRRRRTGAIVLCYHNVVRGRTRLGDTVLHLAVADFEWQMDWLARHFTVVGLRELTARVREGRSLRGLAAVSFDDGYGGVLANALPILRERGLPSTVFVTTAATESGRPFWWDLPNVIALAGLPNARDRHLVELEGDGDRIRALAGGAANPALPLEYLPSDWSALREAGGDLVEFGAHSVTHRTLISLGDRALREELDGSRSAIETKLGQTPTLFAYPYGYWDSRVRDAALASGFAGAFSLDGGDVEFGADCLALPRVDIPSAISHLAFEAWVSGFSRLKANRKVGIPRVRVNA